MRLPSAIVVVCCAVLPLRAEESSRVQGYGGFATEVLRAPSSGASNYYGWNASAAYRVGWKLSAVADVAGYYGRENEVVNTSVHTFLFGPRLTLHDGRISPFVQVLVGTSRLHADSGGPAVTATAFTFAAGCGVDLRLTHRLSLRLAEFDYERRRFFGETPDGGRVSAGIVVRLGR